MKDETVAVRTLDGVVLEAGLLPVNTLPLGVWPDPELLRRPPAPAPTEVEIPDTLAETPCTEPLVVKTPAAVTPELEAPGMLAELCVEPLAAKIPATEETDLVCDAAVDALV